MSKFEQYVKDYETITGRVISIPAKFPLYMKSFKRKLRYCLKISGYGNNQMNAHELSTKRMTEFLESKGVDSIPHLQRLYQ